MQQKRVRGMPTVRLSPTLRTTINNLAESEGITRTAMLEKIVRMGMISYLLEEEELELSAN